MLKSLKNWALVSISCMVYLKLVKLTGASHLMVSRESSYILQQTFLRKFLLKLSSWLKFAFKDLKNLTTPKSKVSIRNWQLIVRLANLHDRKPLETILCAEYSKFDSIRSISFSICLFNFIFSSVCHLKLFT